MPKHVALYFIEYIFCLNTDCKDTQGMSNVKVLLSSEILARLFGQILFIINVVFLSLFCNFVSTKSIGTDQLRPVLSTFPQHSRHSRTTRA